MPDNPVSDTPEAPKRIQRKRTKGWRMPPNTVSVCRPGKFGNPFTIKACMESGYAKTVEDAAQICVEAHSAWMRGKMHWAHGIPMKPPPDVGELRGKHVACFCSEDSLYCHGDTLIELAKARGETNADAGICTSQT